LQVGNEELATRPVVGFSRAQNPCRI